MKELTIFEDNQSAIQMSKNPKFHGRAKHIGIKFHFICELVGWNCEVTVLSNRRNDCRHADKRSFS